MATLVASAALAPFAGFINLDGCHCVTHSLGEIFHFHGHPLSEEMLFGLGAGMGFVYWRMKMGEGEMVFVGGRGNVKGFYQDLARRTGVTMRAMHTASPGKAEDVLLRSLTAGQPMMLGGDMAFLPWFELPPDYHFGGHTFVACGYDGGDMVLVSDMDQKDSGRKKGLTAPITLEQLRKARSSPHKPFPPGNLWLDFDFNLARRPTSEDVKRSIRQTVEAELNPPIKNLGVRGMRHAAEQLLTWPEAFSDRELRMNLFGLYVSIEIGGTGGGCFRSMYARFLAEAALITGNDNLLKSAADFHEIGAELSLVGNMFKDAATMEKVEAPLRTASLSFRAIADREEAALRYLQSQL